MFFMQIELHFCGNTKWWQEENGHLVCVTGSQYRSDVNLGIGDWQSWQVRSHVLLQDDLVSNKFHDVPKMSGSEVTVPLGSHLSDYHCSSHKGHRLSAGKCQGS